MIIVIKNFQDRINFVNYRHYDIKIAQKVAIGDLDPISKKPFTLKASDESIMADRMLKLTK